MGGQAWVEVEAAHGRLEDRLADGVVLRGREAGEQRRDRGLRPRGLRERALEHHALRGERVELRRHRARVAEEPGMVRAPGVDQDEEHVGRLARGYGTRAADDHARQHEGEEAGEPDAQRVAEQLEVGVRREARENRRAARGDEQKAGEHGRDEGGHVRPLRAEALDRQPVEAEGAPALELALAPRPPGRRAKEREGEDRERGAQRAQQVGSSGRVHRPPIGTLPGELGPARPRFPGVC